MERLTKKELRALLECIKERYPICDRETLQRVLSRLSKIVPTEVISSNGGNPRRRRNACAIYPNITHTPSQKKILERVHGHPVFTHHAKTHDVRALNITEFLMECQFHVPGVTQQLVIRLVSDLAQRLLTLEEQPITTRPQSPARFRLSPREARVLDWVAQGKTNKEIGVILELSARTVQKHLEHIYQKMGVENRTGAAAKAYEIASGDLMSAKNNKESDSHPQRRAYREHYHS